MNKTDEIYVTMQGLEDMKKELEYLQKEKRPEVIEALKEARALGDLSENAEYDAARSEQAEVESKIASLSLMIENAKLITDADTDEVSIGNTVTVEYVEDNEKEDYTIVGSTEADPFENKISNESPIAQAIMGLKVGEVAKVSSPNGEYAVKVLEIK
ncbi:MAG: transcription elongation factor GreA [Bacilli bacterium]|nr:transcription elongation factor GreA [Bacilli bacterium]